MKRAMTYCAMGGRIGQEEQLLKVKQNIIRLSLLSHIFLFYKCLADNLNRHHLEMETRKTMGHSYAKLRHCHSYYFEHNTSRNRLSITWKLQKSTIDKADF